MSFVSKLIKRQSPLLGIDLTCTSAKLLELSRSGNRYRVENYAVAPFSPNAVIEQDIKDAEEVSSAIRAAVNISKAKASHAVIAMYNASVITNVIQMPNNFSDEELEGYVEIEANKFIPYSLDEVNLDFATIGASAQKEEFSDILVVASRRDHVEKRVDAVEDAGLTVDVVDVELYAVERCFTLISHKIPNHNENTLVAVVDIGATMTTLTILQGGKAIYNNSEVLGGRQLTEEIMQRYDLSYAKAGYAKKTGDLPEDYHSAVLEPFKGVLSQQISRLLQFFYSSGQHNKVDHILLAGGCVSINGLVDSLQEQLGIPTMVSDPFADMIISPSVNVTALNNDAPALFVACGLAMRGLQNA